MASVASSESPAPSTLPQQQSPGGGGRMRGPRGGSAANTGGNGSSTASACAHMGSKAKVITDRLKVLVP
ncbi:hypothetical protein GGI11_008042, partial [Coemansia sp. RSA 2049]